MLTLAGRVAVGIATLSLLTGTALAFHSGGVAECEGCHTMHNSRAGLAHVAMEITYGQGAGPYLLKASDASGSCLNCHGAGTTLSGYHVSTEGVAPYDSTVPAQMTPGGDFSWLKKTMNITIRNTVTPDGNLGERHGHNIIAANFGYAVDSTITQAPGGTYPSSSLSCISCHDPHGRSRRFADGSYAQTGLPIFNSGSYNNSAAPIAGVSAVGAYRILGGQGYSPVSAPGAFTFANPVPSAVVASTYNRSEAATQTGIAYGQGMSEWCANCHTGFLETSYASTAGHRHPAGNGAKLTAAVVANYNTYVTSGRMTGAGTGSTFSTLAPFEVGTNDFTVLKPLAVNGTAAYTPAAITNNVACVSCHRAHATGFDSMLRFFYLNEFMTVADASNNGAYDSSTTENKINYGYNVAQQTQAYYGRPATVFGPYARNQCNKCHAKD